jgi:D-amino-acid dehydrogenase
VVSGAGGHEVTVIDRQSGPALETSFANAGEISPGYASPWAAPGIPMKALRWLMMKHAPLILRPRPDMAMLRWLGQMLGQCNARDYAINKSRMVRLAEYSRDWLIELRQDFGIAYDERSQGTLQLFREEKQLDGMAKDIAVLEQDGVPFEVLDRAGCLAAEPGLAASSSHIAGGLRLPNDETGDCFKFTNALAKLASGQGVRFTMAPPSTVWSNRAGASPMPAPAGAMWRPMLFSSPWAASRRSWWRLWGCACRSIR